MNATITKTLAALAIAAAALATGGCATAPKLSLNANDPSISVRTSGVYIGEERVKIGEVPKMLNDADIPKTRTVHILLDSEVRDLTEARQLMWVLAACGYQRPVLVTKRHAESEAIDSRKRRQAAASSPATPPKRKVRYRGGNE